MLCFAVIRAQNFELFTRFTPTHSLLYALLVYFHNLKYLKCITKYVYRCSYQVLHQDNGADIRLVYVLYTMYE